MKKIISIILIIILTLNLVLFVTGILDPLAFWILIAAIAFIAYKILPKTKAL